MKQAAAEAGMQTTVLSPGDGLVKFARAFCGKAIGVEDNTQITVLGNNGYVQALKSESKIQRSGTNNKNCCLVRADPKREPPTSTPGTDCVKSPLQILLGVSQDYQVIGIQKQRNPWGRGVITKCNTWAN